MSKMRFSEKVYRLVQKIPRGSVLTYKEVARLAGNPKAARAVGNLMARNRKWPRIPCHRVIRSDKNIGQWSGRGGKMRKAQLLRKEGHVIRKFQIVSSKS